MALTPEFDTEQLGSLALWGTDGTSLTFGGEVDQATLNVNAYGTNSPGQTQGEFDSTNLRMVENDFEIGKDYKIDMRIHGRFLNLRVTDRVNDTNANVEWAISGMQADIMKGGTR